MLELTETLIEKLCRYSQSDVYPFHMPGHKRNMEEMDIFFPSPYQVDITEIEGFDNLHHAEGILKNSMEWAAGVYGAEESFYLVNGSSCGILSAVSACVSRRGKILISRNCHKSVYHAVLLNELDAEYVYPQIIEDLGIQGGILPEDVEKKLNEYPDIQAVLIVSPTYDGIVSDIQEITKVVHRNKKILIVDEAHGAHFPFSKNGEFPSSALENGADIVIQSLHKTLPSLTQTAILHLKNNYLSREQRERIKQYLSIYQSSSPSYILMAGIEYGIHFMEKNGQNYLSRLNKWLEEFREKCRKFSVLEIPGKEYIGKYGVYDIDCSKILMVTKSKHLNGKQLGDYLRREFSLELEMCAPQYALALTSVLEKKEGLDRLYTALSALDERERKLLENKQETALESKENSRYNQYIGKLKSTEKIYTIFHAAEKKKVFYPIKQCEGKISGGFVYVYPPGIPCLVPGERISREIIFHIEEYLGMGLDVQGMADTDKKMLITLIDS